MTQEEKQLLLQDICTRLPYKVKFGIGSAKLGQYDLTDIDVKKEKVRYGNGLYADLERCKPFLRPMSSMTDEENKEFQEIKLSYHFDEDSYILFDWLNKKMFDYRGLIPMGLAIETPNGMYV